MYYTNVSGILLGVSNTMNFHWVYSPETNFIKKQILARGVNLILTPASFATGCLDTILGAIAGVRALCTAGRNISTLKISYNHLKSTQSLIARPYLNFLRAINPEAETRGCSIFGLEIQDSGEGLLTNELVKKFKENIGDYRRSRNYLMRHVATRLAYALMAVSCVITRLADGIIGVPAACLSIFTAGRFAPLNNIALRGLQAPGIIKDLFYCTVKVINPWATSVTYTID